MVLDLQTLLEYEEQGLVYSQVHPTLPLQIFNYTDKVQWEGLWDEITLSARGLILDNITGKVVARPFRKFFNLSEGKTNVTPNYKIFPKYDGSLGVFFNYKGEWILASRGSFTSEQAIKGREILDRDLDYSCFLKEYTYCFEIIFKENKIVVDYFGKEFVQLLAIFNTATGEEIETDECLYITPHYTIDTPLEQLNTLIDKNEEGYVVRFCNGERCKIKGAEYLRLHKLMSEMSTTAVWECLKNGDSILDILIDYPDEWYNVVKEYEQELKNHYNFMESTIRAEYKMVCKKLGNYSDKEFALYVKDKKLAHFLFALKDGKDISQSIWKFIKPEYKRL